MYRCLPMILLLAACGKEPPPIAINGYCEVKATERIDMTDRGLRGLTPENKRAVLNGDDNWKRECGPSESGLKKGGI